MVEYQIGNKNIVLDQCEPKQSVYIFGCRDSVIQVKGRSYFQNECSSFTAKLKHIMLFLWFCAPVENVF